MYLCKANITKNEWQILALDRSSWWKFVYNGKNDFEQNCVEYRKTQKLYS